VTTNSTLGLRVSTAATSWPFLVALCLLLLNDLYLKRHYGGLLTGKLSDFSGVFLVSLTFLVALPGRPYLIGSLVSALFFWWKSPMSEGFIEHVQAAGGTVFGRVVDYSDLAALATVPMAHRVAQRIRTYWVPARTLRRVLAAPIVAAAFVAIMGTSFTNLRQEFEIRETKASLHIAPPLAADIIRGVAESHGLKCMRCERLPQTGEDGDGGIELWYDIRTDRIVFVIAGYPGSAFSGVSGRMDRLQRDLSRQLEATFKNLEFAAPLRTQR